MAPDSSLAGQPPAGPFGGEPAPEPKASGPAAAAAESAGAPPSPGWPTSATAGAGTAPAAPARQAVSGLKAGFADDNKQFNYFVQFQKTYGPRVGALPIPVEERIALKVRDSRGKPIANAAVAVATESGRELCRGLTYADGSFLFFPALYGPGSRYQLTVTYNQAQNSLTLERGGRREVAVAFGGMRADPTSVPLDLLFIMDTTGSMGEEIERLKTTIELIRLNLSSLSSRPRVRFGMVLYRDRGDEYVTRVVPFTDRLEQFQEALNAVEADGGGDTPEDLQSALQAAVREMAWNRGGARLGFIITDAPPHLDYESGYTYADAAQEAKAKGIKLFSVGTGGLDLLGEFVLRQVSQLTSAKYIFLTYGEAGESEGGAPGSVSHHTGANYQTDKLEAIIIRFAKEELAWMGDQPLEEDSEYFEARRTGEEEREQTLAKLFGMAVSQLVDYSSYRIPESTPASVLPFVPAAGELSLCGEYFTEQLILTMSRDSSIRKTFRMVERKDLQKLLEELELQLSALAREEEAARVGRLMGADLLLLGKLYGKAQGYELFLKLVRVETGEVLSVTKALIDRGLGL
jgi:Mg-chelatase subunit ChlD